MLHKSASLPRQWKGRAPAPRESHAWQIHAAFSCPGNLNANHPDIADKKIQNYGWDLVILSPERSRRAQHNNQGALGSISVARVSRVMSSSLLRHVRP